MNNVRIHFIGTAHEDMLGAQRLEKALQYEKPDIITVESSEVMMDYMENEGLPKIVKKINSLGLSATDTIFLIELLGEGGYERKKSKAYASKFGIPIYYVDDPSLVAGSVKAVLKMVDSSKKYFTEYLSSEYRAKVKVFLDKNYLLFQSLFDGEVPGSRSVEQDLVERIIQTTPSASRDEIVAQNIEAIIKPGAKIVHVGGAFHSLRDVEGRTLFTRLRRYNPTRATLKWYEDK